MALIDNHLLVFRAYKVRDFASLDFAVFNWYVYHCGPPLDFIGQKHTAGDGVITSLLRSRRALDIESVEIARRSNAIEHHTWGMYERFMQGCFTTKYEFEHICLWRAYEDGRNLAAGPLLRSDFTHDDIDDLTTQDSFYHLKAGFTDPDGYIPNDPPGHLPCWVVPDGSIIPSYNEDNGLYSLSWRMLLAEPDV